MWKVAKSMELGVLHCTILKKKTKDSEDNGSR